MTPTRATLALAAALCLGSNPTAAGQDDPDLPRLPNPVVVAEKLAGQLVRLDLEAGALVDHALDPESTVDHFLLFYSAGWSPACSKFTPALARFYEEQKAAGSNFEVIFVSVDDSEAEMVAHMVDTKMPWPAVRFGSVEVGARKVESDGDEAEEEEDKPEPPPNPLKFIEQAAGRGRALPRRDGQPRADPRAQLQAPEGIPRRRRTPEGVCRDPDPRGRETRGERGGWRVSDKSPPKPSHASTRWVLKTPPDDLVAEPGGGLPPVVETILATRGIGTAAERERFLNPKLAGLSDPFSLPDMEAAVERLFVAIDRNEKIALYGDYDVDGVTSLTLLKTTLAAYGSDAGTFLPHRVDEGYGLSIDGLERCLEEHSPNLLVAVDCGTTSIEQAAWLNERGVQLIILDHHEASPEGRPDCCALVNPKAGIDGKGEEYSYLCSAGVVFKLAHAMLKKRPNDDFDLREYLDVVAVGTVADIVPLVDENRALVRRGLLELARTRNYGLAALAEVAGVNPPYGASDIGFRIGPRLNAAGRLDTAGAALDLLLCDDPAEARVLADDLDARNRERQEVEKQTADEVMAMIESGGAGECGHAIVVGKRGWHPGVVGIVASRVSRKFYRPTFIIAIDEETGIGKGSGRSIEGVSLVDAINSGREHLEAGGGHAMAAGISVHEDKIVAFRKHLNAHVREHAEPDDLKPLLKLDAECRFSELRLELLDTYAHLEPFGSNNPEPVLLARRVFTTNEPRILKDKHYRLTLRQDGAVCDAIYFGGVEHGLPPQPWDVAFTLLRNDFRGRVSLQMNVRALREATT